MYQQILCPVDGSSTSDCGMTHAIALAKDQKAHLHFLHVVDNYFPIVDITGDLNYIDITERLREHGKTILTQAIEAAKLADVSASTQLVTSTRGQIYKSILDYAEQCQADLIVMGTHGLRGVERLVMGSDAETIARTSPVPVLLVRTKLKTKKAKT
ncbi:MAG TPA: universal stress protein [Methylotenera sp.]|nr:universal stress protein [Methylotenera sp.]